MQSKLTTVLVPTDFNYQQPEFENDDEDLEIISEMEDSKKEIPEAKKETPVAVEVPKKEREEPQVSTPAPPEKRSRSGGASAKKKHKA